MSCYSILKAYKHHFHFLFFAGEFYVGSITQNHFKSFIWCYVTSRTRWVKITTKIFFFSFFSSYRQFLVYNAIKWLKVNSKYKLILWYYFIKTCWFLPTVYAFSWILSPTKWHQQLTLKLSPGENGLNNFWNFPPKKTRQITVPTLKCWDY